MKDLFNTGTRVRLSRRNLFVVASLVGLLLALSGLPAQGQEGELAKEDRACLNCHEKEGAGKPGVNGEGRSLQISTQDYLASRHKDNSCEDCHADLDAKTHGKGLTPLQSKRELTLSMRESCRTCHKKKFTEYEDSVHAALIKDGSVQAPVCSDCHNPHTVRSTKLLQPIAATSCVKCHEDIFKAYAKDVHGQQRIAHGKGAPLCADCHKAHAVKAASLGDGVKDACLSCHQDAVAEHKDWLPNAARHFEAISCPVCHAPGAQRRVNLRLYDGVAQRQVSEKTGVPQFERRVQAADAAGQGLDERALWSLLKDFNRDGGGDKTILRGRLEVRSGVEAHQLSEKSLAIRDCSTCHQSGAEPFQSVTLTIAAPDGRPLRHPVQKEVLSSLTSMQSVRGFYAIGSTRIGLLDSMLVLVVLGAISVPVGHMTLKRLFRRVREKLEAERKATASPPRGDIVQGDRQTHDGPTN